MNEKYDIIFFDGVCNLCNNAVQFIIRHDKKAVYKFASLQSDVAKNILSSFNLQIENSAFPQSIILIRNNKIYFQSSAALRIAQRLSGIWKLFSIFLFVPKFIRDDIYNWVARNRYKWFGKRNECMIPTPELRDRFLE